MHGCIQGALGGDLRALRAGAPVAVGDPCEISDLALKARPVWEVLVIRLKTDSLSVHRHLSSPLSGPETGEVTLKVTVVMAVVVNLLTWHLWAGVTTIKQQQPAVRSGHQPRRDSLWEGIEGQQRRYWRRAEGPPFGMLVLRFVFFSSLQKP